MIRILLVEDSAADVRLTQEVLRDAALPSELHVAGNGDEAMGFLQRDDASGAEADIQHSYDHAAASYVAKPLEVAELRKVIRSIDSPSPR